MQTQTSVIVHNIVQHFEGGYDHSSGCTADDQYFCFLTNFNPRDKEKYISAIVASGLQGKFAMGDDAYGFDEDTGQTWKLYNTIALYYSCDHDELQLFHAAYRTNRN